LGKSKVALDYSGIMALRQDMPTPLKVLIIAPRIAIDVWHSEIEKHFPFACQVEDFDEDWFMEGDQLGATHFFLAGREETFIRRAGDSPKRDVIEDWRPHVVVIDESHEYSRPGGRAAQDAWRLVRRMRKRHPTHSLPYVLLLSGTPNPKGWRNLFAQFRIMDDTIFGTAVADFDDRHTVRHPYHKWKILRYKGEKRIIRKIRAHSVAVSADEAGLANETFFQSLKVQLPPKVKRFYLEFVENFVAEWEDELVTAKNAGVKRLRCLQICGGFTTSGSRIHGAKVASLKAYLHTLLGQGESVLVYSRFTPEVNAAYEVLEDVGYRAFRVDGSTTHKDRRLALAALGRPPVTPSAISFQYQAGSRAIELVGAAETVFYSPSDSWVDYWQALKRTQGPNQKRPCRYTHLICPGTVDVSAIRGLQAKEDWHSILMANPRRYLLGLI
jgi:hypothetical protein